MRDMKGIVKLIDDMTHLCMCSAVRAHGAFGDVDRVLLLSENRYHTWAQQDQAPRHTNVEY